MQDEILDNIEDSQDKKGHDKSEKPENNGDNSGEKSTENTTENTRNNSRKSSFESSFDSSNETSAIDKIQQELDQIEKIEKAPAIEHAKEITTPVKEVSKEFKMPEKIQVPKLIQRPPVPQTLVQPPKQFQKPETKIDSLKADPLSNSEKDNDKDSLKTDTRTNDTGSNGQKNDSSKNNNNSNRNKQNIQNNNRRKPPVVQNQNQNPNRNQPAVKTETPVPAKVVTNRETSPTDRKRFDKKPPRRNNENRRDNPTNRNQNTRVQQSTEKRISLNLSNKSISVIIPLYNEEESLAELSIALRKVMDDIKPQAYEVIFIDDGSTDSSYAQIQEINRLNKNFKCIKFKRNYGKSAALSEGFKAAKGDYVITMDADLQDDPDEIPALILKLQSGYDLVSGWKKVRHDPFIKKHTSKLFNFATSTLVGLKLHDYNCGLKGYVKDVVKSVKVYGEMHRYIPAMAYLSGFKVAEIPVTHHERKFGKTKFGASRFVNGIFDLMTLLFTTKYIKRPLHFFGFIGMLSFTAGFGILAYLTVMKFVESYPISGRPLFFVGILFSIVGMQSFSIGLIGEMITKSAVENDNIIIERTL